MLLVWLVACTNNKDDSSSAPPLRLDDTASCSSVPPEVQPLSFANGGFITGEDGTQQPSIRVDVTFTDVDSDVDVVNIRFWWDGTVDGTVDVSSAADHETGPFKIDPDGLACAVSSGTLQQSFGVNGQNYSFNTWYDFAATVTDVHGLESDPSLGSGVTPKEDGSNGDPR